MRTWKSIGASICLALIASLATAVAVPTASQAAEVAKPICMDTPDADEYTPAGSDYCRLQANAFTWLDGEPTDLLANDGEYLGQKQHVIDVDGPYFSERRNYDPSPATIGYAAEAARDEYKYSFYITIPPETTRQFWFYYTTNDGMVHHVVVDPIPFVAPLAPRVSTPARKGYIKVCAPQKSRGGSNLVIMFGKRTNPEPDGRAFVPAGTCKIKRVHRRSIFWVAYRPRDGALAGYGMVRDIVLKQGDGPHRLPDASSVTKRTTVRSNALWQITS